jgi:hypothetical protein
MKVKSIRVSTIEENADRQTDFKGITYIDECIDSVAFKDRPKAKKITN